jgi:hypothetical protein
METRGNASQSRRRNVEDDLLNLRQRCQLLSGQACALWLAARRIRKRTTTHRADSGSAFASNSQSETRDQFSRRIRSTRCHAQGLPKEAKPDSKDCCCAPVLSDATLRADKASNVNALRRTSPPSPLFAQSRCASFGAGAVRGACILHAGRDDPRVA